MKNKSYLLISGILMVALFSLNASIAQCNMSYDEFRANYKPHDTCYLLPEELMKSESLIGIIVGIRTMEPYEVASALDELCDEVSFSDESVTIGMAAILTSSDRVRMGKILSQMNRFSRSKIMSCLDAEWALDLLYYLSESAYEETASSIPGLESYSRVCAAGGTYTYTQFHRAYTPKLKVIPIPGDNNKAKEALDILGDASPSLLASILEDFEVESLEEKKAWEIVFGNIGADKIGSVINRLANDDLESAVELLNTVEDHQSLDILYFADRSTFNRVSPRLKSLRTLQMETMEKSHI